MNTQTNTQQSELAETPEDSRYLESYLEIAEQAFLPDRKEIQQIVTHVIPEKGDSLMEILLTQRSELIDKYGLHGIATDDLQFSYDDEEFRANLIDLVESAGVLIMDMEVALNSYPDVSKIKIAAGFFTVHEGKPTIFLRDSRNSKTILHEFVHYKQLGLGKDILIREYEAYLIETNSIANPYQLLGKASMSIDWKDLKEVLENQ